jgi:beta-lactamase class A
MTADERRARGIEEIAAELGGVIGVGVRDVRRGRALDYRAEERFPAASVIKVAILVELMARVEAGDTRLEDRFLLQDADRVPGSGVLSMLHEGIELTVEDLAHLMITVSDNTASNVLIDRLGADRINGRLESLGLRQTRLERKFYDFEARARGLDNWAAAGELADLLTGIERRRVVSPGACEKMLQILRRQQFDGRIPRLLPPDTPVANKTGTISGVCHDAGIIYAPAGPLALAVLTRDCGGLAAAEGGIRHIARLAYQLWGTGEGSETPK